MPCNCGKNKKAGAPKLWKHIGTDGKTLNTYSSETDARIEASKLPGSTVRPA